MSESTRQGLRAAIAAALAITASRLLALPRSYWAILVAVVLVTETWGESNQRAFQRLSMTALGCVAGALLHVATSGYPHVEEALLFVGVFFAAYFRQVAGTGSYAWMIFFITLYVVFLFAVLGQWDVRHLVAARIADTAVGCAATLAASALIPPAAARQKLEDELRILWACARALIAYGDPDGGRVADLLGRLEALRARHLLSTYEDLFAPRYRRRAAALVLSTGALCHASISLARSIAAARSSDLPPGLHAVLDAVEGETLGDFDALESCGDRGPVLDAPAHAARDLCAAACNEARAGCEVAWLGAVLDGDGDVRRLLDEIRVTLCA